MYLKYIYIEKQNKMAKSPSKLEADQLANYTEEKKKIDTES